LNNLQRKTITSSSKKCWSKIFLYDLLHVFFSSLIHAVVSYPLVSFINFVIYPLLMIA